MPPAPTFTERSYRVSDDRRGRGLVCDTAADPAELGALRDALGWRRRSLGLTDFESADAVIALRALIALDDKLLDGAESGEGATLTVTRGDVARLAELAGAYVAERDGDSYQSIKERSRIQRLRALSGRLMDACSEFAAAEAEARDKSLLA